MPYLAALSLTLVVELPVYALALVHSRLTSWRGALIAGVVVNLVTHPLVWLLLTRTPSAFVPVELAAWTVEFGLLFAWLRRDATALLATAALANALSTLAGLVI